MVDRSREELKGELLYHKEEDPRYTEQNPTKITGNTIPTLYEAARRWDIGKHAPASYLETHTSTLDGHRISISICLYDSLLYVTLPAILGMPSMTVPLNYFDLVQAPSCVNT